MIFGSILAFWFVDEFHRNEKVSYIGTRFAGPIVGMPMPFEQKTFPGFTAALQFVGKRN